VRSKVSFIVAAQRQQ